MYRCKMRRIPHSQDILPILHPRQTMEENGLGYPANGFSLHRKSYHWRIQGGAGGVPSPPPTGSNSFVFAFIFAKKHPHQRSVPPPARRPPMGNPGSATAYLFLEYPTYRKSLRYYDNFFDSTLSSITK